jgi:hypothetical protein
VEMAEKVSSMSSGQRGGMSPSLTDTLERAGKTPVKPPSLLLRARCLAILPL